MLKLKIGKSKKVTNKSFIYYDLNKQIKSTDISLIFEGWSGEDERITVLSPHDDDALLGAGYLLLAAISEGCEPYVLIFCDGRGGYSNIEEKDRIVSIRREESTNAYEKIGIKKENIMRFDYPDFSLKPNIGWVLPEGKEGTTIRTIKTLREIKPTRLLIPNEYRENMDHEALSYIGTYDGPQVGDPILADVGRPSRIKGFLKYSVWGDFSPEDALLAGRDPALRGNVAIKAGREVEEKIIQALKEFKSQERIIDQLIKKRSERIVNGSYIEVYLKFNPRPSIEYDGYKKKILEIDRKS